MIEFLSCIHLHSEGEDLNEISKTKSIRMVPTLCGMSSTDKYCSSSRDVRKPRVIQPSSRKSLPSIHWVTRPKNFIETDTETFFRDQNFRDRDRDFFSRPNIFETDTETFFRDQMFSRPIPRLFFETKCFRDRYRDFFETKFFRDWYRDFCKS